MNQYFQSVIDNNWIFFFILLVLLIWNLSLSLKFGKLKKRFTTFTRSGNVENLEQLIEKYLKEIDLMKKSISINSHQIDTILKKIKSMKGNIGIIRYNAFGEEGNDLSYSIAFLDEKKDGIVISSIYNRGESNTFAKPIKDGSSNYKLSVEELNVIKKANE